MSVDPNEFSDLKRQVELLSACVKNLVRASKEQELGSPESESCFEEDEEDEDMSDYSLLATSS